MTTQKPSATVATVDDQSSNGIVELQRKVNDRIAELVKGCPIDTGEEGINRLLLRLADSETIEDAAAVFSKMDNSRSVADIPLMVTGFMLRESEFYDEEADDGGLPFYATVFATNRDTGAELNFNVSAKTVMVSLMVGHHRGWFPFTAHIETGNSKRNVGRIYSNLIFDA